MNAEFLNMYIEKLKTKLGEANVEIVFLEIKVEVAEAMNAELLARLAQYETPSENSEEQKPVRKKKEPKED